MTFKKRLNLVFANSCSFLLVQTLRTREQQNVRVEAEEQPFYPLYWLYILFSFIRKAFLLSLMERGYGIECIFLQRR